MAHKYGDDPEGLPCPTLAALDTVWTTFGGALRESGDDPNAIINMIGLAFGQVLVDRLGLAWVVATDEHGTEIALHGELGDLLVYPTNLVGKRWASGEDKFLDALGTQMIADIAPRQDARMKKPEKPETAGLRARVND
jgi:hypothetical protein